MGGFRLGALAAFAAISAAASAHASVEVIDFEDGVVGSTYWFTGEAPIFNDPLSIVKTDGTNKYLDLNHENLWVWPGSPAVVGGVKTAHQGVVTSLDVFLFDKSALYVHGARYDLPTGDWQHVVIAHPSDFGTYIGILGDGYVDNITYDDVTSSRFVPEPATWAMMILGFGMIGAMTRSDRRRKAA